LVGRVDVLLPADFRIRLRIHAGHGRDEVLPVGMPAISGGGRLAVPPVVAGFPVRDSLGVGGVGVSPRPRHVGACDSPPRGGTDPDRALAADAATVVEGELGSDTGDVTSEVVMVVFRNERDAVCRGE